MAASVLIRRIRLVLWVVIAVAVGFFVAVRYFAAEGVRGREAVAYAITAREGVGIVEGMWKFRAERGLWPEFVSDLTPDYLKINDGVSAEWEILPGPSLLRRVAGTSCFVRFDFNPASEGGMGWKKIDSERTETRLDVEVPVGREVMMAAATRPTQEVREKELAELDKRIGRTVGRDVMGYFRQKASVLHAMGRDAEIAGVLREAEARVPGHFWPLLTAAVMEGRKPEGPTTLGAEVAGNSSGMEHGQDARGTGAAEAFVEFVRRNPSFTHYFYLAWFFHRLGEDEGMRAVLAEATKYPLEIDVDDFQRHDVFGFWAVQMAYELRDYPLVLELVGRWERRAAEGEKGQDSSFMAFRAAAELRMGQVKKATEDAEAAVERNGEREMWAGNLDQLLEAAKAGKTGFVYEPGKRVREFEVFAND